MITNIANCWRRSSAGLGRAIATLAIGLMTAAPAALARPASIAAAHAGPAQTIAAPRPAGAEAAPGSQSQTAQNGIDSTIASLSAQAPALKPDVLRLGLSALGNATRRGLVARRDLLTVIDYSLPSTTPRLFTFDLKSQKLLFRELVAHGKNSGDNQTVRFSNDPNSLETSLGLFVTEETYFGHDGYSLKLQGLDKGFNDLAMSRNIVLHGAAYVSDATAHLLGRLGRSFGCPAVPSDVAPKIIDALKGGTAIFAYYPDPTFLHTSTFLNPAA